MLVLSSGLEPMHVRICEAVAYAVQGKCTSGEWVIVQHIPMFPLLFIEEHCILIVWSSCTTKAILFSHHDSFTTLRILCCAVAGSPNFRGPRNIFLALILIKPYTLHVWPWCTLHSRSQLVYLRILKHESLLFISGATQEHFAPLECARLESFPAGLLEDSASTNFSEAFCNRFQQFQRGISCVLLVTDLRLPSTGEDCLDGTCSVVAATTRTKFLMPHLKILSIWKL